MAVKALRAGIVKAAARPPAAHCPAGHPVWRPDARMCPSCSTPMSTEMIPSLSMVGKNAVADQYWRRELAGSPDPANRELYYRLLYGEGGTS
jgi:hypothetical protein